MKSGDQTFLTFQQFVSLRDKQGDWLSFVDRSSSRLNRTKIARECGFGRGVFFQNEKIKSLLASTEARLKQNEILYPISKYMISPVLIPSNQSEIDLLRATEHELMLLCQSISDTRDWLTEFVSKINELD